jgi:hypothetical protein
VTSRRSGDTRKIQNEKQMPLDEEDLAKLNNQTENKKFLGYRRRQCYFISAEIV